MYTDLQLLKKRTTTMKRKKRKKNEHRSMQIREKNKDVIVDTFVDTKVATVLEFSKIEIVIGTERRRIEKYEIKESKITEEKNQVLR